MSISLPIVNTSQLYADGFKLSWASATTLTLGAGSVRNSTDENDIIMSSAATINGATTGANALDTGSLANDTFYAVYAIDDSTKFKDAAGLISTDTSSPLMPAGYDMWRRVGWVLTDGSAEFLLFWQYGNNKERMYYYDVGIAELTNGTSTTYAEIDLASSVPPIDTEVLCDIAYTPNSATNTAVFIPFGSSASAGIVRFGYGVAAAQVGMAMLPSKLDTATPKVEYKVSNGSDDLDILVKGYKDYI